MIKFVVIFYFEDRSCEEFYKNILHTPIKNCIYRYPKRVLIIIWEGLIMRWLLKLFLVINDWILEGGMQYYNTLVAST
jgi:hypothetical protein